MVFHRHELLDFSSGTVYVGGTSSTVSPNKSKPYPVYNLPLLQIHLHVHFWTKLLLSGYLMQVSALDVLRCVKGAMRGDCVGVTHSL